MAITQNITAIPKAGKRGIDTRDAFVTKQEAFQDALTDTFVTQINAFREQANELETNVNNKEASATQSATTAITKATEASSSATSALASRNDAKTSETNANASEVLAGKWANENENVIVQGGKYSAKHYALKAEGYMTNALVKQNNLSDITNKATARDNLELGTASTRNVGTNSGNVMEVGAFGLGGLSENYIDFNDIPTNQSKSFSAGINRSGSGVHGALNAPSNGIYVGFTAVGANGFVSQIAIRTTSAGGDSSSPDVYVRNSTNGVYKPWYSIAHSGNLQTSTGQSTEYPMTQKAVTDALNTKLNSNANAVSATKLQTARTINGVAFDGTANITVEDSTKAPLNSPVLTGTPTAPTPVSTDNSTKIATTAFVKNTSFGLGQHYLNVKDIRSLGVTYTNNTGKPILMMFRAYALDASVIFYVNSVIIAGLDTGEITKDGIVSLIIPDGSTYSVISASSINVWSWFELR